MQFSQSAPRPRSSAWSIPVLLLVLGLGGVMWWQRFAIQDWVKLRGYTPPAAIVKLADDTTMKDGTRRVFYANRPVLEPKGTFNTDCKSDEKTIVLGCYAHSRGIYLFDVADTRLDGIEQVTAAHEVLHALYDRLSGSERKRIDTLTAEAYASVTDERIRKNIQSYQDAGADVPNELHSILATEVRNLPSELEEYYGRYFFDRRAIIAYSEKYENEFTSRKQKVAEYDARLGEMRPQIDALNNDLVARSRTIQQEYNRLQALKNAEDVDSYNAGVRSYNALVTSYNSDVRKLQAKIAEYNTMVNERNELYIEQGELQKAIDSRTNTIETE